MEMLEEVLLQILLEEVLEMGQEVTALVVHLMEVPLPLEVVAVVLSTKEVMQVVTTHPLVLSSSQSFLYLIKQIIVQLEMNLK
jgi:hypothetical protein